MNTQETNATAIGRLGQLLLALLMFYSAAMHFKFSRFDRGIVPAWIPWRLFWVYFTGLAMFAAGLSIVIRRYVKLAATLLGVMLLIFVLLIHAPSMVNSVLHRPEDFRSLWSFNGTGGTNNALKDIALTISAFMLAFLSHSDRTLAMERAGR